MKEKTKNIKLPFIFKNILIVCGMLLLIYAGIMLFTVNYNAGIVFAALLAAVLISLGVFFEKIIKIKWLSVCIGGAFATLLLLMSFIAVYGQCDTVIYTEDALIVLGAGIDGKELSPQLKNRLDKAVEYSSRNSDAVIIVSGGQGAQETVTEALAMERYLIEKGISANRITREEASVSTRTNLNNSKKILDEIFDYDYSVALITSDYHVYRASEYAQSAGLNCNHAHADIEWYSAPMRYLRECAAIIKLWLFE